ncbi:MAG TPA: alpha/beta hydrolase, partial [Daejeonella sp.]|nr:alpha/beta hydrolase [Daejeonella sp.]
GLSFGGMIAIEISKFLKPEKLILFSTVKTRLELPSLYRLAGKLRLYKLLPDRAPTYALGYLNWFFGPLDQEGRALIAAFQRQTDPVFLKWALKQISRWRNNTSISPHIHIHGSKDRAFPVKLTNADYVVRGSGHLCVFTNAAEVNEILVKELGVKN